MSEKPQKVGLISDTHIPVFAKALPEKVIHIFKNNKALVHFSEIKNFDFNHVYIDAPTNEDDPIPQLNKKVSCVELVKHLYLPIIK